MEPTVGKKRGKTPGSGRKAGTPNKSTAAMREVLQAALDRLGGADYIVKLATQKGKGSLAARIAVLNALTKLLPVQVTGDGEGGGIQIIVHSLAKPGAVVPSQPAE